MIMKVVFYINSLCFGGAERVVCNLATQLSESGYEVVLVTSFPTEKEYVCGSKVRRIYLGNQRICSLIKRNLFLIKKLRRVLKIECPDILISFMAEPNFRAIIASLGLKNKVMISVRNDPEKEYSGMLIRLLAKTLFRFADGIVFQTEDAKMWFPMSIQKKSEIIYNQVDDAFYRVKCNEERCNIVTVGRLTAQKNHKLLIRSFASISDRITDNLIIYGEGELRNELEALISALHLEDRVILPGVTKNVAEMLASAKLFVLSSDYEGMPNALMEAMAIGIPCIASNCPCGGPKMLFGDLLVDRLFACGDEKALSEKIENLIFSNTDGEDEKRLAEQFRPEVIISRWKEYIEKACK